jgi:hypothetical protein
MIRHCGFFRFLPETTGEEKHAFYREIAAVKDRVPGFVQADIGPNVSPRQGWTMATQIASSSTLSLATRTLPTLSTRRPGPRLLSPWSAASKE